MANGVAGIDADTAGASRIRELSPLVANQIAAGEVVERPASVVKELVENAIDAGASRIVVELEGGGVELVRVSDDGGGMSARELPMAVRAHATSKIQSAQDLDRIGTMGFRGEALASVASVSRLKIVSRRAGEDAGSELSVEGDVVGEVRPAAREVGTSVHVRNLFFNTPARRKFLRTAQTERGHCVGVVEQLAMAHANIGFRVVHEGKLLLDVPAKQGLKERVLGIIGGELGAQMLTVEADAFDDARGMTMWGMVGRPELAKATAKSVHVFVNGRAVRDKTVQHALREAYRGLTEPGRWPVAVVLIEMDPRSVDVNVHPGKAEVRFRDQSMVHQTVLRSVGDALRGADLTVDLQSGGRGVRPGEERAVVPTNTVDGSSSMWERRADAGEQRRVDAARFVEYLKRGQSAQHGFGYADMKQALDRAVDRSGHRGGVEVAVGGGADDAERRAGEDVSGAGDGAARAHEGPGAEPIGVRREGDRGGLARSSFGRILQVHDSYVVTQDESGLVIVDQHALHERVLFEALLARVSAGPLERQRMLVPVVVDATGAQVDGLADLAGLLEKIGVELEPAGERAVSVQAFPTLLIERGVEPGGFVAWLLERGEEEGFEPSGEAALHEVLDMMACKAAVKAGDRLSGVELEDLLGYRDAVERSSNCPHGRPTSIRVSLEELERRFGRR